MKKLISIILCLIICLSLFACNAEEVQTTAGTKATKQTEDTKDTQQTQATSGNNGSNSGTNGNDNTENPIFFELTVENKIINIPDKKIEYISFSNDSDVTKIQNKHTIERIITAIGNMTVHEEPNPVRYFGGSIPSFNIYFSDNTYTRVLIDKSYLTLDMGPSSEPKICYAPDDRERMENLKMALGWIDIQTIGTFSIFPTIVDTEFSNGTVSFSKYVKNIKITKYSHYDHDLDIPPYTISNFVMYNYEETIEEFTEVFCSLDFLKVSAAEDIPNYGEYSYAKFEFYFDYGDSTFFRG